MWATNTDWKMRWECPEGWWREQREEEKACSVGPTVPVCLSIHLSTDYKIMLLQYIMKLYWDNADDSELVRFNFTTAHTHKSHKHSVETLIQMLNFVFVSFFPWLSMCGSYSLILDNSSQSHLSISCEVTMCRHSIDAMLLNLDVW